MTDGARPRPAHRRAAARADATRRRPGDRGAATAELAMVLPLLLVVTLGLVWLLAVGAAQVRTIDAAREAVRGAARGDSVAESVARARRVAPPGSRVILRGDGRTVTAVVVGRVPALGGVLRLPDATVSADAVAAVEDAGSLPGTGP